MLYEINKQLKRSGCSLKSHERFNSTTGDLIQALGVWSINMMLERSMIKHLNAGLVIFAPRTFGFRHIVADND